MFSAQTPTRNQPNMSPFFRWGRSQCPHPWRGIFGCNFKVWDDVGNSWCPQSLGTFFHPKNIFGRMFGMVMNTENQLFNTVSICLHIHSLTVAVRLCKQMSPGVGWYPQVSVGDHVSWGNDSCQINTELAEGREVDEFTFESWLSVCLLVFWLCFVSFLICKSCSVFINIHHDSR